MVHLDFLEITPANDKGRGKENEQVEPSDCDMGMILGKGDRRKNYWVGSSSMDLQFCILPSLWSHTSPGLLPANDWEYRGHWSLSIYSWSENIGNIGSGSPHQILGDGLRTAYSLYTTLYITKVYSLFQCFSSRKASRRKIYVHLFINLFIHSFNQ